MNSVPYVDFYSKHKVSPVSQDLSDLDRHFSRREYLYRALGIPVTAVKGCHVAEFGPGSGHNSIFTLSCRPSSYLLVDGNETGLNECRKLLEIYQKQLNLKKTEIQFQKALFEDFQSERKFDLVLAEGFLPAVSNPEFMLAHLASFLQQKGILVVTCHDSVSLLADNLRCYFGSLVASSELDIQDQAAQLVPIFREHFNALPSMSRPHTDWIIDNILHKSLWLEANFFSIGNAITECLKNEGLSLDFYSSSPSFKTDWRWYKAVHSTSKEFNQRGLKQYQENLHGFLNSHETYSPREASENLELLKSVDQLTYALRNHYKTQSMENLDQVVKQLQETILHIKAFSPNTAQALTDFLKIVENNQFKNCSNINWGKFSSLWGRGMQYASFLRD
jgi:2-polyprenyl-3-methyl-5-hydroxy-6-metoxy-1,4-benzoquinol methylase